MMSNTKARYPPIEIGSRYGKLTVISEVERQNKSIQRKFNCVCDCGKSSEPYGFSLKDGSAQSCGCIAANMSKERWKNPTPEMRQKAIDAAPKTHGLSKSSIYRAWVDIKRRCLDTEYEWYASYGGRGIDICADWMSSVNFINDMYPTWQEGLQIGRIDNDSGYRKDNCRWETPTENQNNKSNTVYLDTPDGRMTIYDAKHLYGLNRDCLKYRYDIGMRGDELIKPSQREKYEHNKRNQ